MIKRSSAGMVFMEMTEVQYNRLIEGLAYASGAARKDNSREFGRVFTRLLNEIHEGDPEWVPLPEKL